VVCVVFRSYRQRLPLQSLGEHEVYNATVVLDQVVGEVSVATEFGGFAMEEVDAIDF